MLVLVLVLLLARDWDWDWGRRPPAKCSKPNPRLAGPLRRPIPRRLVRQQAAARVVALLLPRKKRLDRVRAVDGEGFPPAAHAAEDPAVVRPVRPVRPAPPSPADEGHDGDQDRGDGCADGPRGRCEAGTGGTWVGN